MCPPNAQCKVVVAAYIGPSTTSIVAPPRGGVKASPVRPEQSSSKALPPSHDLSSSSSSSSESSSEEEEEEEEEDDDDDQVVMGMRGTPFKHFGKRSMYKPNLRREEEDEDSPAFLPGASHEPPRQDLNATLRQHGVEYHQGRRHPPATTTNSNNNGIKSPTTTESSPSSAASSGIGVQRRQAPPLPQALPPPGLLSPQRSAQADLVSRGSRRSNASVQASDGTPSMGSSFSDLDGKISRIYILHDCISLMTVYVYSIDASVSQSALEEALLSNMQRSRLSTISQALRSRHL